MPILTLIIRMYYMSSEYENLNIEISAEFDEGNGTACQIVKSEAEAIPIIEEWINGHIGGPIHWPLCDDNKIKLAYQLILKLNQHLNNKIKNVLIISDNVDGFKNWSIGYKQVVNQGISCDFNPFSFDDVFVHPLMKNFDEIKTSRQGKIGYISADYTFAPVEPSVTITKGQYEKARKELDDIRIKQAQLSINANSRIFLDKQEAYLRKENKKQREIISIYEGQIKLEKLSEINWNLSIIDLRNPLPKLKPSICSPWRLIISPVLLQKESIKEKT